MTLPNTTGPNIHGFFGEYRFLSNFWPCEVTYDGKRYPSVEHAYQAAKTLDEAERTSIRKAGSAGEAKKLGRRVTMRKDWENVKVGVMRDLVTQKFTNDPDLKARLAATRGRYLEETNTWGDVFWGVCRGRGKNTLGHILMDVRDGSPLLEFDNQVTNT